MAAIALAVSLIASSAEAEVAYVDDNILADAVRETSRRLTSIEGVPVCFPMVDAAQLVILSSYEGGVKFGPATSDHRPGLIEVVLHATDRPLYLFLAGAEPNVWRIIANEDVQIAGVALSGYYPQQILDLPPGVPLGSRTFLTRVAPRQQQDCVHEVTLSSEQQEILNRQTFQTIESVLMREKLMKVLKSFGDFELLDHQHQYGSDDRLIFEVAN